MEEKSRTEHSVQNTTTAIIAKMIALLTGFITRVVFTHCLSQTYVGINGLFWDILNVFSLSEFGVGTAITYALYEPVAKGDVEKQKSLMQLYRKIYHIMGGFVLAAGLAVIPFMDFLVKGYESVDHLIAIYLLYLANSVFSYLLIYKKSMLDAHQLSYLGEISMTVSILVQDALQITVLLTTQNFYLFLCMMLLATIGNNIWISYKADRLYPFLKDKDIKPIPKEERSGIYQNIRAMLMHKVGDVLVNNTDNLILSAMVGLISHEGSSGTAKTTKYEHLLPMLAAYDENSEIQGILFILNTIGGDVSCGLALAEMISGLKTPTASFIIGDSHSIGVPLAVATDFSCIVPSATMILHPVRMSGMILGAPQSYDQFEKIQARIVDFIVRKRGLTKTHVEELMMNTSMFAKDLGTLLVGGQAVEEGLVDKVGTLSDVMDYLKQCPH